MKKIKELVTCHASSEIYCAYPLQFIIHKRKTTLYSENVQRYWNYVFNVWKHVKTIIVIQMELIF